MLSNFQQSRFIVIVKTSTVLASVFREVVTDDGCSNILLSTNLAIIDYLSKQYTGHVF